jgi:hypothetical protein
VGPPEGNNMNDIKNIFIAWISTSTSLFAAIELKTVLAIVSAVVLPIIFFSIGKTVDVLLQIHFRRKEDHAREIRENPQKEI